MKDEKILVSLGEGQSLEQLAADLIALADHPHDVDYSPRAGGFLVPETLAGRYAFAADPAAGTEEAQPQPKKPASRARRGRATAAKDTAADTETKEAAKPKPRSRASRSAAKGAAKGEAGVSDG